MKTKKSKLPKWLLLFTISFGVVSSCSEKFEDLEVEHPSNSKMSAVNTLGQIGYGPYDVLGAGYDITGMYASKVSARMPVIDMVKFSNERGDTDLNINNDVVQETDFVAGENIEQYSRGLATKINNSLTIEAFKAEITANFRDSAYSNDKTSYASAYLNIFQKRMSFFTPVNVLATSYLTAGFKADINTLTPQQLVQKYGTHVLRNVHMGGKLEMHYNTQSNTREVYKSTVAGADFSILSVFSVNINSQTNQFDKASNFNQYLKFKTVGGDGTKGIMDEIALDGKTPPKISIAGWQSTLTPNNAAFIQIGDDGLIPLSDLILNATKKSQVAAYIKQYLETNKVRINNFSNIKFGRYKLTNLNSNKVLAIPQAKTEKGIQAVQWTWLSGGEQQWEIYKLPNNTYKIINANSGQALAVSDGSLNNGMKVIQWPWQNGTEQMWVIEKNSNGTYKIKNFKSGLVLAIGSASKYDDGKAIQWQWQNGVEQQWKLGLIY